ncbi:ABC transporter [Natrialba aegyptia DSM 13077]|uniref:ABC transporter n=1 Tax=Natrialba aegyptia DSM 13077 TaxID=1227491 RepID=M0B9A2_9EURY|nr:ABC transporter [Natrialba aegyptia DSM 13077]
MLSVGFRAVFRVILGGRIEEPVDGIGYILFLIPRLVVLGVISNASFSIFHGRWNEFVPRQNTQDIRNGDIQ